MPDPRELNLNTLEHEVESVFKTRHQRALSMVRRSWMLVIAGTLFLTMMPHMAWSWGCFGHETVALVAEAQLGEHAKARVGRLLGDHPAPGHRACRMDGLDLMANVSTWADDVRDSINGSWHFIDIPVAGTRSQLAQFCPTNGCVTTAIKKQLDTLRSDGLDDEQARALRFIIHFVGDIHQPLHCATNRDRGGNCVPVAYFGTSPRLTDEEKQSFEPNLHSVWDKIVIQDILGKQRIALETPQETSSRFAAMLNQEFGQMFESFRRGEPEDWAWESHTLALEIAYKTLPVAVPIADGDDVATCSEDNRSQELLNLREHLVAPYQKAAKPVIRMQLAKAGTRLAMLLNEVWP
jgi:hypothetical protein